MRNTKGLPCAVTLVASAPTKVGIPAFWVILHAAQGHAREHRPHHGIGVHLDRLLQGRLGHLRLGLGVEHDRLDLAPENAAGGVDLLERQQHAVVEIVAGDRSVAGQLDGVHHHRRERVLGPDGKRRRQHQRCSQQTSELGHGGSRASVDRTAQGAAHILRRGRSLRRSARPISSCRAPSRPRHRPRPRGPGRHRPCTSRAPAWPSPASWPAPPATAR